MDSFNRLYRIRKTVIEMLADRGYQVDEADKLAAETKEAFKEKFGEEPRREDLLTLSTHRTTPDQILVFFPEETKVGVKTIKNIAERMRGENVQRAIMVVQNVMTPFAKQCLQEMQPKYVIELFQEAELLVNITKHVLVPQHRILTKEEKITLLSRYKVKETQLPRIQFNDPIARYYGMQRGNVVRINGLDSGLVANGAERAKRQEE